MDKLDVRVVILAGGKGTRLKPLTVVFPKPLVPLGNRPIIEILLRRLSRFGLKDVTICTGYLAELIMAVCGDGSQFGLRIEYLKEAAPLGTAGPLGSLDSTAETFIVMNGDLLTTLDIGSMLRFHVEQQADATIGVHRREVMIDFGVVESTPDGRFAGFREKPTYHFEVSMGINTFNRRMLKYVKRDERLDMPDLIMKVHQDGGKVACYRQDCYWLDIGRMDDYALAQQQFEENEMQFLG